VDLGGQSPLLRRDKRRLFVDCGAGMAESPIITTLRTKRDQIEGLIAHLEDRLKEARTDLAHVNATLRLFELDGEARESVRSYMDLNRMFPRGELQKLCLEALEATQAPMSTREISAYVMTVKGWDEDDKALRRSVTFRIVNTLRVPRRQDRIERVKKQKGVVVWALVASLKRNILRPVAAPFYVVEPIAEAPQDSTQVFGLILSRKRESSRFDCPN